MIVELTPEQLKWIKEKNYYNFKEAPKEWLESKEFMLQAVTKNGLALQYASDKLKDDREIVLAAVTKWAGALQYASDKLNDDREIVLVAVTNDGSALEYASDELNGDPEIVLTALSHSRSWAPSLIDSHPLIYVRCEAILKEIAERSSIGGKKINFDISDLVSGVQKLFEKKLFDENGHEKEDEIEKITNDWFDFNQIIYQHQKMDGNALLSLAQVMQLRYYPSPKDGSDVEEYTRALLIEAIELNDEWLIDIIHRGFNVDEYRDFSDLADKACNLLWNRGDKDYANALMVLRNENLELTTGLSNEFAMKVIQETRELNIGEDEDKEDFENFVNEAGLK